MRLSREAYYADFHKMSFHGGKQWIAPSQLIREERSLYFPNVSGKPIGRSPSPREDLSDAREQLLSVGPFVPTTRGKGHTGQMTMGNVSVVAIVSSQISEEHVRAWTKGVLDNWRSHERFRFIQINLQQNPLRSFLVSLFSWKIRRETPRYLHQSYLVSYDNLDYVRYAIGLDNKLIGYVFLVDWEGRIRWAGCGNPWNGDSQSALSPALSSSAETKDEPEGGAAGQITEGLVQGYGEEERLQRCIKVLMTRLDSLVKEGVVR